MIRHRVDHPEREDEINFGLYSDTVSRAAMSQDIVGDASARRPFLEDIEHFLWKSFIGEAATASMSQAFIL